MDIENIILLSCALVLIQIFTPVIIEIVVTKKINVSYLFASRDTPIENSAFYNRGKRALSNLFETYPIFIFLVLLSQFKQVDISSLAGLWLVFRVIYMPIYILGINYARTLLWIGSLICLILMGVKFIITN